MQKSRLIFVTLLVAALILPYKPAYACSCAASGENLRSRLASVDGAFVGELVDVKRTFRRFLPFNFRIMGDTIWKFRVTSAVKGNFHEETPVQAPLHGASCGLDLAVGERGGLLVSRDGSMWSSSLCSKVSPDALIAASGPTTNPEGGEIHLLVSGAGYDSPITAFNNQGDVAAYGLREARTPHGGDDPPALDVCPGSRFAIEVDPAAGGIYRRNLSDFRTEKVLAMERSESIAVSCRNQEASEILVTKLSNSGDLQIERLALGVSSEVADGLQNFVFHPSKDLVYAQKGRALYSLNLTSNSREDLLNLPFRARLEVSPFGDKLLAVADLGHDRGTHLMLIDLTSRRLLKEVRREWSSGPIAWIDENRFAFSVIDRGVGEPDDHLYIFDSNLEIVRSVKGFGAFSLATLSGSVYGVAGGALLKLLPETGKVERLRSLDVDRANIVSVEPPAPVVTEEAARTMPATFHQDLPSKLAQGRSPDFAQHARYAFLFYALTILAGVLLLLVVGFLWIKLGRPTGRAARRDQPSER